MSERETVFVVGFCTAGFHVRYVAVTQEEIDRAEAEGRMVEGTCASCKRDNEREEWQWPG